MEYASAVLYIFRSLRLVRCVVRKERRLALPLTRTEGTLVVFTTHKGTWSSTLGPHLFFFSSLVFAYGEKNHTNEEKKHFTILEVTYIDKQVLLLNVW